MSLQQEINNSQANNDSDGNKNDNNNANNSMSFSACSSVVAKGEHLWEVRDFAALVRSIQGRESELSQVGSRLKMSPLIDLVVSI